MQRTTYLTLLIGFLACIGCKEEKKMPLFDDDATPQKPQNIRVENTPGGARIYYSLVKDPGLLYIRADFETQGMARNAISSYYEDHVVLEGYGDTLEHEVTLYAMSRSERPSEKIKVTIQPRRPAVLTAHASLTMKEDFGGLRVWYENPDTANLAIVILHKDSNGIWVRDQAEYTKQKQGTFAARGMPSKPTHFGVYVRDRWNNYSDTTEGDFTPIFERELEKPKWKTLPLDGDNATVYSANTRMDKMWDGLWAADGQQYQTQTGSGVPTFFTIDLNQTTKLSRVRYNMRTDNATVLWGHGNPRVFTIYGRADYPTNGGWTGWDSLMTITSVKPSGLPVGQTTPDDVALAQKGEEFDFPPNGPAVRYIRIKVTETWNKQPFIHIAELTLWGQ